MLVVAVFLYPVYPFSVIHDAAGLSGLPQKFWDQVVGVLFKEEEVKAHRYFQVNRFKLPLPCFLVSTPWMFHAGITNSMLQDIFANYRQGGTVRDLASFYNECLASGGGLTKSAFLWNCCLCLHVL